MPTQNKSGITPLALHKLREIMVVHTLGQSISWNLLGTNTGVTIMRATLMKSATTAQIIPSQQPLIKALMAIANARVTLVLPQLPRASIYSPRLSMTMIQLTVLAPMLTLLRMVELTMS